MKTFGRPKVPWVWIVTIGLALAVTWVVGSALHRLFAEPQGVIAAVQRQVVSSRDGGLEIVGWAERTRAPEGRVVSVWFRLTNSGAAHIQCLRLALHAPGFSPPDHTAASPKSFPVYSEPPGDIAAPRGLLWDLPQGVSRTIRVDLAATGPSGAYMLTASFTWKGAGATSEAITLDLGPLQVRSGDLELIAAWKDFATVAVPVITPLIILLIGWRFQARQQEFVQTRQAWFAMLPVSHQNNLKSYLPLLSAIETFEDELKEYQKTRSSTDQRSAFFYFLLSIRMMREVDAAGGFYLTDRSGEDVVVTCWNSFRTDFRLYLLPHEDFSSVVDAVDPRDSLSSFTGKLYDVRLSRVLSQQEERFKEWALGDQACRIKLIALFRILLLFEINRIYDFWYGKPGDFPFEDCIGILRQAGKSDAFPEVINVFAKYAEGIANRRQRSQLRGILARLKK